MNLENNKVHIGRTHCCYCEKQLKIKDIEYTKEHLVPKSIGGFNSLLNLVSCCNRCNTWRGSRTFVWFKLQVNHCITFNKIPKNYTLEELRKIINNIDYWDYYVKNYLEKYLK